MLVDWEEMSCYHPRSSSVGVFVNDSHDASTNIEIIGSSTSLSSLLPAEEYEDISLSSSCPTSSSDHIDEEEDDDVTMRLDLRLGVLSLRSRFDDNDDDDAVLLWEELEDDLFIILKGNLDNLHEFEKLYNIGIKSSQVLRSSAYICSMKPGRRIYNKKKRRRNHKNGRRNDEESSMHIDTALEQHVTVIAHYLSLPTTAAGRRRRRRSPARESASFSSMHCNKEYKFALVKTLIQCLSPGSWQSRDVMIHQTVEFLTSRQAEWEFIENHSEAVLLWELRAMTLHCIDKSRQHVINRVATTGDSAAIMISTSAKLIETGLVEKSVPAISRNIETAGTHVKGYIKPDEYPLMMDRDAVVAMVYSDAARRSSVSVLKGTKYAVGCIKEASSKGMQLISSKFEDRDVTTYDSSDLLSPEGAAVVKAAGRVGMATLGAAAIVGEAVLATSQAVVRKTADVTVDVVRHKYGESAGQVVDDAGEITRNILGTLGNVALLEGSITSSSLSKEISKTHVNSEYTRAKESMGVLQLSALGMMKQSMHQARIKQQAENHKNKPVVLLKMTADTNDEESSSAIVIRNHDEQDAVSTTKCEDLELRLDDSAIEKEPVICKAEEVLEVRVVVTPTKTDEIDFGTSTSATEYIQNDAAAEHLAPEKMSGTSCTTVSKKVSGEYCDSENTGTSATPIVANMQYLRLASQETVSTTQETEACESSLSSVNSLRSETSPSPETRSHHRQGAGLDLDQEFVPVT